MKLSKYATLVKNSGHCIVAHVGGSGIWLGIGAAIYRATELPDTDSEEQVRALLDMPEKAWEKVHLDERWPESVKDIFGMDLSPYVTGEQDAEKLKTIIAPQGRLLSCVRCKQDDELLFFNDGLLSPLMAEIRESDYIKYTVRTSKSGNRFLVVHDGFDVLAAILPVLAVNEEFLGELAEFQALCTEQFYREQNRARARTESMIDEPETAEAEEDEAEQIGMEDGLEHEE